MRISALHLQAYGHFAAKSLVFGGQPGLHVIYGDNEAGKSTTLRALSSVLFGYPYAVVDDFRHDAKDIVLGAELIGNDGQILSFLRKRRGKNALAKVDGTPLEEAVLAKMLGNTSRDVFEKVFALDHHRLHEHAVALLSEGGSLGFTLAAAGSGLSGLKATLDRIKVERDQLFLPGGSKPKLNQRIAQLVELRKEVRRRAVSPVEYKKRQKESDEIDAVLAEQRTKDHGIEAELRKLERIARHLPLRAQYSAALSKLETLSDVPILSPDAAEKRTKAETDRDAANEALTTANDALAALDQDESVIALDQAILDKAATIQALSAQRAVIENADQSLPRRDAEREQHYATVRNLLAQAELAGSATDLATLLPSLVKRKQVSILADKGRALLTQHETLTNAAAVAEEDVRLAQERLDATEAPADLATLQEALLAADTLGDIHSEIAKRRRTLDTKSKTTADGILGLRLEHSDAAGLRKLSVPSDETVARFRQAFTAADTEQAAQTTELMRLRDDLRTVESRIAALSLGGTVVTKEELGASRAARATAWAVIRGVYIDRSTPRESIGDAPEGDIAGTFERREADADGAADAIIAHSQEAAELSLVTRQKAETENKIAAAETKDAEIGTRRQELETDWKAAWPPEGIRIERPAEMAEWLKRREVLLREDLDQQAETNAIADLEVKQQNAGAGLRTALKPLATAEETSTLAALRAQARALINAANATTTLYAKAVEALASAQQRQRQAGAAQTHVTGQIAEWSGHWKSALHDAGLKDGLAIDAAVTVLEIMAMLDGLKQKIDDLSHRIQTMTDDKRAFEAAIATLGALISNSVGLASTEMSRQLEARLDAAKTAESALRTLREQRKIHTAAQRQASERLARAEAALTALCAAAGCADASALISIEQASLNKQDASHQITQLETRLLEDGSGLSLEVLLSECEGVEGDALPGRIATLTDERVELQTAIEKSMNERATLRAAFEGLFGPNQSGEALQDAANVEADIAVLAQDYADLTLQEITLRQAIDLYRDRNQGPILGRARTLFAQLTDIAYSGLRADVDENDEPVLIAEHASRGSLEVQALSDGTVDPLYLALRLAVVQEHNATNEPLPFIADDLLLNLDDTRARATLRTLGEFAGTGQVLFFTHHAHMVELARTSLPASIWTEHRL